MRAAGQARGRWRVRSGSGAGPPRAAEGRDSPRDGHRDRRTAWPADSPAWQPDSRAEGGPAELPAPAERAAATCTVCHDMAKHK